MHVAVAYCRYSPRPGGESCDSNRMQVQRCRAYCRLHNYTTRVAARHCLGVQA